MTNQRHLFRFIGTQAKVIARLSPGVHRTSGKRDVHALRVAIRRAQAAFWLISHSSSHSSSRSSSYSSVPTRFGKLKSDLKALEKALGGVRELDVAVKDARHFGMDTAPLKKRRKSAGKYLKKVSSKTKMIRLGEHFLDAEKSLMKSGTISLRRPSENLKNKMAAELILSARGKKSPHHLRIILKKVKYSLEAMGKPVTPLKKVIKLLGEAHDLEFVQTFLQKNRKVEAVQNTLNGKAKQLTGAAFRFATRQLNVRKRKANVEKTAKRDFKGK